MSICSECNMRERRFSIIKGKKYFRKTCKLCERISTHKPYLKYRKNFCEFCGFIPVNMCQLDVDHVDGNHNNNSQDNLQTLCANCHRLKTFTQLWEKKK